MDCASQSVGGSALVRISSRMCNPACRRMGQSSFRQEAANISHRSFASPSFSSIMQLRPRLRERVGSYRDNRKIGHLCRALGAIAVLLTLAAFGVAQTTEGTPNWTAYDAHQVDTIDLSNLNIAINIPVMSKRGAIPFSFGFTTNSGASDPSGGQTPSVSLFSSGADSVGGLDRSANGVLWDAGQPLARNTSTVVNCPGSGTTHKLTNWYVLLGNQTVHYFPATDFADSAGCLSGGGFTDVTIDQSGYQISVSATGTVNSIHDRDGNSLAQNGSSITDPQGNT